MRALEAIARELTTPVINLRRAVGSSLGTSPYTLGRFMKDCRHPGPLGHAWIAQLIAHALQQVDPSDAEQVADLPLTLALALTLTLTLTLTLILT